MPVPSFLFLTGVNRRKNTRIKNQSAGQELRIQGRPGQTGDLCPSSVSLFLPPLPASCHPFLQNPKILHNGADYLYLGFLHVDIHVNQLSILLESSFCFSSFGVGTETLLFSFMPGYDDISVVCS